MKPDMTKPDQTRWSQAWQSLTKPDQARHDKAWPNQMKPDMTKAWPTKKKPDEARLSQWRSQIGTELQKLRIQKKSLRAWPVLAQYECGAQSACALRARWLFMSTFFLISKLTSSDSGARTMENSASQLKFYPSDYYSVKSLYVQRTDMIVEKNYFPWKFQKCWDYRAINKQKKIVTDFQNYPEIKEIPEPQSCLNED